ncbi:hypothetical protein BDN72DRAFT_849874 [Pluteus cervinus]|uniref:Uncharacterized protein n=1 Tax=Pluteus cervinus TaxID=181527 RepID=A0ACD3A6F5_9AGAR|nr:hypothetical protein BDN72DRAFT_849874 [Pluteus cervinus]
MGFNGNDFCIQSVSLENQLKLCRSQLQHLIKEDEEMHAQVQKWVDEEFKKWQQAQKYVE